jgi:hypothetical protein
LFTPFSISGNRAEDGEKGGVIDGARTRDNQNHNLGLYQLSYDHRYGRVEGDISPPTLCKGKNSVSGQIIQRFF